MRSVGRAVMVTAALCFLGVPGQAQDTKSSAPSDPRLSLKPGLTDAGQAIRNLELVASVPKPQGFFDPKQPAGVPIPPESKTPEPESNPYAPPPPPTPEQMRIGAGLSFANSDLAFSGNHLIMGNFNGFNTYDLTNPKKPKLIGSVLCPGGQGDVSV